MGTRFVVASAALFYRSGQKLVAKSRSKVAFADVAMLTMDAGLHLLQTS